MSIRRMLPFILINIIVSAAVALAVLFWWERRQAEMAEPMPPAVIEVTAPLATAALGLAALPTDTPEPEGSQPLIHIVKAGENLGSISQFYEVDLEDIMTVNGIGNPNLLSVGQELEIPIGGIPTPTPPPTETPAPAQIPSPIPTEDLSGNGEVIVEITAVAGSGRLAEEIVQITNRGGQPIALLGWQLADADGYVYTFGPVTLFGDGAAIQLHTETGIDTHADLFWGLETPIWASGELVTLSDADGNAQAAYQIP